MSELKPCKKHKMLPSLKEIEPPDSWQALNQWTISKRFEYVCYACEAEKEVERHEPLINEWNKKQEEQEKK